MAALSALITGGILTAAVIFARTTPPRDNHTGDDHD